MSSKPKAPKTIRDKLEAALIARGAEKVVSNRTTTKRVCYELPNRAAARYYLGANGSLRVGTNFTTSRPASAALKANLLAEQTSGKPWSMVP